MLWNSLAKTSGPGTAFVGRILSTSSVSLIDMATHVIYFSTLRFDKLVSFKEFYLCFKFTVTKFFILSPCYSLDVCKDSSGVALVCVFV